MTTSRRLGEGNGPVQLTLTDINDGLTSCEVMMIQVSKMKVAAKQVLEVTEVAQRCFFVSVLGGPKRTQTI